MLLALMLTLILLVSVRRWLLVPLFSPSVALVLFMPDKNNKTIVATYGTPSALFTVAGTVHHPMILLVIFLWALSNAHGSGVHVSIDKRVRSWSVHCALHYEKICFNCHQLTCSYFDLTCVVLESYSKNTSTQLQCTVTVHCAQWLCQKSCFGLT